MQVHFKLLKNDKGAWIQFEFVNQYVDDRTKFQCAAVFLNNCYFCYIWLSATLSKRAVGTIWQSAFVNLDGGDNLGQQILLPGIKIMGFSFPP